MKLLNVQQGTPEWHAARATHDCASEAAAALGFSKNCTRSELMKIKHTGITPDVSGWTQKFLFDKGHEVEALARPIVAKTLGEGLHTVTGESDDGKLLASLDGFTMFGDTVWENKMLNPELRDFIVENNDLPDSHWPQCEHQILVTEADRVYFTVSDGTEEGTTGIFYESKPERRQLLIAGWAQFNKELAEYVMPDIKEMPKADVTVDLPTLFVHAKGEITTHNMDEFGKALAVRLAETRAIILVTDQDFSNAKAAATKFRDTAKAIALSKAQMLAQTKTIGEAAIKMDAWAADLNATALQLEKDVKREDLAKKEVMVLTAKSKYVDHVAALEAETKPVRLTLVAPNFAESIKGKSKYANMQDAVDTMLAGAIIAADQSAKDVREKLAWCKDNAAGYSALFPDLQQIIVKPMEDFALTITSRIDKAKADEGKRLEAERERIRAEEQARANALAAEQLANERRAAQAKADADQAERNRLAAEEIRRVDAERKLAEQVPAIDWTDIALAPEPTEPTSNACLSTIKLGEICARLGFTVTADFLASLNITPAATDKNVKLYDAEKFPAICRLIADHVMALAFKKAA